MAGNRCLTFTGSRLVGATVCLFDDLPQSYLTTAYHHGTDDVCRKMKYPPAHDCKVLGGGGDIISEISFIQKGVINYIYPHGYGVWVPTARQAFDNMNSGGVEIEDIPDAPTLSFNILVYLVNVEGRGWSCYGVYNKSRFVLPSSLLDPLWREDDSIFFSVAFTPPFVGGAPDWAKLTTQLGLFDYCIPAVELPVSKELFYLSDFPLAFSFWPWPFAFEQLNTLPEHPLGPDYFGWDFRDAYTFNLRLIVRRGSSLLKVCWPEDILKKAKCAAVVDTESGLVVGPPILIE